MGLSSDSSSVAQPALLPDAPPAAEPPADDVPPVPAAVDPAEPAADEPPTPPAPAADAPPPPTTVGRLALSSSDEPQATRKSERTTGQAMREGFMVQERRGADAVGQDGEEHTDYQVERRPSSPASAFAPT